MIDSTTARRLFFNFLANLAGKAGNTVMQLVAVPVFLHMWRVPLYGEWLLLNSIPSYLALSDVGFGSVAGNEIAILTAQGDLQAALAVFQSVYLLISGVCIGVCILGGIVICFFPVTEWLHIRVLSEHDAKWIICFFGFAALFSLQEQLFQAAFRAVGRFAFGTLAKNVLVFATFAATLVAVLSHSGALVAAGVFCLISFLSTVVLWRLVKREVPWLSISLKHARSSEIRRLLGPAVSFMGFPVGNAMSLQGPLFVIGIVLGPAAVVVFGTARTVSRIALQMTQMVSSTFWPEISVAYGLQNIGLMRTLHRRSCQLALALSGGIILVMAIAGPWFLNHWTGGHVPPSRPLLAVLLLVVIVYSLWSTSSTFLAAINKHQKLAARYVLGTTASLVVAYPATREWGLIGTAWSLLAVEIIMSLYVVPAVFKIVDDSTGPFFRSMLEYPRFRTLFALVPRLFGSSSRYDTEC